MGSMNATTRLTRLVLAVAACVLAVAAAAESEVVGWRGNWTGSFPQASPPTRWQKVSKPMVGLRCQAEKPGADAAAGAPAYWGALPAWQVLGPFPSVGGDAAIGEALVPDEAGWEPDFAAKVKDLAWRKVVLDDNNLDFAAIFGAESPGSMYLPHLERHLSTRPLTAFAHTYVYSPADAKFQLDIRATRQVKVYLNGALVSDGKKPAVVTLKTGWNRLLCKSTNQVLEKDPGPWTMCPYPSYWYVGVGLFAAWPYEWETKGIQWATPMPNWSAAHPVLSGDRIFLMSEPNELVCVSKADGRLLWRRAITFFQTLTPEETAGSPALQEIRPLAEKLDALDRALSGPTGLAPQADTERGALIKQIGDQMRKADRKKYGLEGSHGNCLATPVSDGRRVYVWMPNISLAACYDREGTRLWSYMLHPSRGQEHGMHGSPVLAGGKLIFFKMELVALDAATGKEAWKTDLEKGQLKYGDLTHASPIAFRADGREFVFIYGHVIEAATGRIVLEEQAWKSGQDIATPIVVGGTLYGVASSGQLHRAPLPQGAGALSLKDTATLKLFARVQGAYTRGFVCASPLYHEGLLYVVDCMGSLYVVDDAAQKLLYRKNLGVGLETGCKVHHMGTCYASPIFAGGNLYVFGVNGIAVVFKPGREYREVARNKIEDVFNPGHWSAAPEGFSSTPVPDGKCLYIRGDKFLYCVGE